MKCVRNKCENIGKTEGFNEEKKSEVIRLNKKKPLNKSNSIQ